MLRTQGTGRALGSRRPQSPRPPRRRPERLPALAAPSGGRATGAVSTAAASRETRFSSTSSRLEAGVRRFDLSRFRDTLKAMTPPTIGRLIADFGTKPRWRCKRPCCLVAVEIDGYEIKQSWRHDPNMTGSLADRQDSSGDSLIRPAVAASKEPAWPRGISARSPPPSSGALVTTRTALSPSIWIEVLRSPTAGKNLRRAAFRHRLAPRRLACDRLKPCLETGRVLWRLRIDEDGDSEKNFSMAQSLESPICTPLNGPEDGPWLPSQGEGNVN